MTELLGQVAIITGGSRGIGTVFAQTGADIALCQLDDAGAAVVANAVTASGRRGAGRLGVPEDIAQTALLLAGKGGGFCVGACLSPNGEDVLH